MLNSNCKKRRRRRRRREKETSSHHHAANKDNESQLKLEEENQVKKFENLGFRLLDLPSCIIIEILTRIPIDEILHCRCVCKTLRSLISDPSFVKDFISKTPFFSTVLSSLHTFDFIKLGCNPNLALGYKKMKPVNISYLPDSYRSKNFIGCSNGVICFWDEFYYDTHDEHKIYITNPVLGEFAVLPNPPSDKYAAFRETYGFCFCPYTEQYKVIKIKTRRDLLHSNQRGYYRKTEVWIMVVGSNTWRYVGDAPFPFLRRICNVILNGCIHWIVDHDHDCKGPIHLHAVNITEEQAHPVPAPPELSCDNALELGVMGKYLCFFDSSYSQHLDIWCMKEYGVTASWTKDRIITTSIHSRSLRPVAAEENGMILMSNHWGRLFCYDPKEDKFTEVYDFSGVGAIQAIPFTPTFLSLKHITRGASLEVRKHKSYNSW